MGKHEIRLRRQRLSARGSDRFRNYGAVLKQHGEEKRIKLITRIFTFLFLIIALIIVLIVIARWENKHSEPQPNASSKEIINKIT
ncbi:MAG: hypothetical protein IPK96_05400 [Flammeovirgaceae bacterium]|jgi:preprotein translocase subunit SecG|nr:hypothetical protein [Flammeovirgaceae bacterium]